MKNYILSATRLVRGYYKKITEDDCFGIATQLAFAFIFSLFPFLLFLVALTAFLPLEKSVIEIMGAVRPFLPEQAYQLLQQQLNYLLQNEQPSLLTFSFLVALWSASRGIDVLRMCLNRAYDVRETRPWWRTQLLSVLMTVGISLVVLICTAMILAGGRWGEWVAMKIGLGKQFFIVWSWLRWPTTALILSLVTLLAYFFLPDVTQRFRYLIGGAFLSTILWLLITWGFSIYVEKFGNYQAMYGAIGGAVILLLWLYLSGLVLILGGEWNAVCESLKGGKALGARTYGEKAPPLARRPSAAPPAIVRTAKIARRT